MKMATGTVTAKPKIGMLYTVDAIFPQFTGRVYKITENKPVNSVGKPVDPRTGELTGGKGLITRHEYWKSYDADNPASTAPVAQVTTVPLYPFIVPGAFVLKTTEAGGKFTKAISADTVLVMLGTTTHDRVKVAVAGGAGEGWTWTVPRGWVVAAPHIKTCVED